MARCSTTWKKGQCPNKNGRPPKEQSLTELMREYLYNIPEGQKKTYKEMFIEKTLLMAMKGDIAALKLIWQYMDGMPIQQIKTDLTLTTEVDEKKQQKNIEIIQNYLNERKKENNKNSNE